jgi:hypothetical protein
MQQLTNIEPVSLRTLSETQSPPVIHISDKESLRDGQSFVLDPITTRINIDNTLSETQTVIDEEACTPHLYQNMHEKPASLKKQMRERDSSPRKERHMFTYDPDN